MIVSGHGRELFYRTMDQQLMAMDYSTQGDSFVPDKPRLWAATTVATARFLKNMDMHADGKRFLTLAREEGNGMKYPVAVVLNVFDAMRLR